MFKIEEDKGKILCPMCGDIFQVNVFASHMSANHDYPNNCDLEYIENRLKNVGLNFDLMIAQAESKEDY